MLMQSRRPKGRAPQGGFLLIEVLVSMMIFTVGLLALMGAQTYAINDALHGKYRTDASYLANSIIGQMMVDRPNVAAYADGGGSTNRAAWDTAVATSLPNGASSIAVAGGTAVTVTVRWRNPEESTAHSYVAVSQVVF